MFEATETVIGLQELFSTDSDVLQLAVFGVSVATFELLRDRGGQRCTTRCSWPREGRSNRSWH